MRASQDSLVGTVLDGRYRVTSRIARGGMATVYRAIDSRLDREVAVKVMHPHLAEDPQFVDRFHREAKSAARMSNPNVVAVFDQGQTRDVVYLVMEYVPGTTLRDLLTERHALTTGETLEVLEPLLDALSAAHRAGLVHRDVKPENVLITDDGRVKVADFGLARAASTTNSSATTGMLMGTAAYLAPELLTHGVADARSDVYAAGIMTFEMLTGRQPFTGEVPIQVAFQHVNSEVPAPSAVDPGLPPEVDEIVTWATAREPDLRPHDAAELAALARQVHERLSDAQLDRLPVAPPLAGPVGTASSARLAPTSTDLGGRGGRDEPVGPQFADPDPTPSQPHQHAEPLRPVRHTPDLSEDDDVGPRKRRRGVPILISLVVLALVLGGIGWFFTAGPGAYTDTPRLTGTSTQANATLKQHGLNMKRVDEYSETVDNDRVIRTQPAAGQRVHKNGTVDVVVSQGSQWTAATTITGKTPDEARTALTADGLTLGETTDEQYSNDVKKGSIVSQAPAAGERIKRGDPVSVVLSKGREPITVPNVAGQSKDQASAALTNAGLRPAVSTEYSETVPKDAVIRQNPDSGRLFRGDRVQIVVSSGPPLVAVPNVATMRTAAAREALVAAGFTVKEERVLGGPLDTVGEQSPAGGTAPKGSVVTIRIV